jgi:hypothetical protein
MGNYIVRIYRSEKDNPRKLVGLVEEVGKDGRRGFTNLDELWGILNPSEKEAAPERGKARERGKGREQ